MNIEEVRKNAYKKSTRKGIPVTYKGKVYKLDSVKASISAFALTATLVIAGVGAFKTVEKVQEVVSEGNVYNEYANNYGKYLNSSDLIYRSEDHKSAIYNYPAIAFDILENEQLKDIKLYSFATLYGNDSDIFKNLLISLSALEEKKYSNIEEYAEANGFNSAKEWTESCQDKMIESRENSNARSN